MHLVFQSKAKPFVKWAGGKTQLLEQFKALLPKDFDRWENVTYIEPFVGGGAMLFFLLQHFQNISRVIINDINKNLTNTYFHVKNDAEKLVEELKQLEQEYLALSDYEKQKLYYLEKRHRFNNDVLESIEKSALLIFLNRTCFNGLYRENSKGEFNVPFGKYNNPTICNEEVIYADSELLNYFDVNIMNSDFLEVERVVEKSGNVFIYFDPPFRPLNTTSSFNSYVKEEFDDRRQVELSELCRRLSEYGNVSWMLSNADCSAKNPNDTFFETLYSGFNIHRVYASRSVNANGSKRGKLTELLITNY